jgi:hypothetical protein
MFPLGILQAQPIILSISGALLLLAQMMYLSVSMEQS